MARKRNEWWTALALGVALVLAAATAFGQQSGDGYIPPNGKPSSFTPGGGWSGSAMKAFRTDPNGILRTTEEYPLTEQKTSVSNAAASIYTGLKAIGNGIPISPYGNRVVLLTRTSTGTNGSDPTFVYLYGSDDDVTYKPIMTYPTTGPWTSTGAYADTASVDSLCIVLGSNLRFSGGYFVLPDWYLGHYVQVWARRDSSSGTAQTLAATWLLREK